MTKQTEYMPETEKLLRAIEEEFGECVNWRELIDRARGELYNERRYFEGQQQALRAWA